MKPTKKIIEEFPNLEENLINTYNTFKDRPTTQNYSRFCIAWGIYSQTKELFKLSPKMDINKETQIYFTIQDYSKDILIY